MKIRKTKSADTQKAFKIKTNSFRVMTPKSAGSQVSGKLSQVENFQPFSLLRSRAFRRVCVEDSAAKFWPRCWTQLTTCRLGGVLLLAIHSPSNRFRPVEEQKARVPLKFKCDNYFLEVFFLRFDGNFNNTQNSPVWPSPGVAEGPQSFLSWLPAGLAFSGPLAGSCRASRERTCGTKLWIRSFVAKVGWRNKF